MLYDLMIMIMTFTLSSVYYGCCTTPYLCFNFILEVCHDLLIFMITLL